MKKISILSLTTLVFLTAISSYSQTSNGAFVGTWVLNTEKTKIQELPREFKGYKIIVAQNDTSINIKNFVDGTIEPRFNNQGGSSVSSRDSIWGDTRQSSTTGMTVKPNYSGSMALSKIFTPLEVAYSLDGKEKTVDIMQNGEAIGTAKIKAKMEKEGKSLQITIVRRMKTMKAGQTEVEIYVREKWDVVENGKMLKYSKTVELPSARDDVILYFNRTEVNN